MAYGNCNTCGAGISWDKQKREAMNTRRPLNYDGTIHTCGGNGSQQVSQQKPSPPKPPAINQEQRTKDIKDAQEERKRQHVELIKNLQWNTKMLARIVQEQTGKEAREILDSMGFEDYQEEQRQEGYEDL